MTKLFQDFCTYKKYWTLVILNDGYKSYLRKDLYEFGQWRRFSGFGIFLIFFLSRWAKNNGKYMVSLNIDCLFKDI